MRLALAQVNPTVGDLPGNANLIVKASADARAAAADLVLLPELCLCAYPPRDLLLEEGFVEACERESKRIGESLPGGITAIFGLPLPAEPSASLRGTRVANALAAYRDGRLVATYHKRLLPTYDVFDEDRYFSPGARCVTLDVRGVQVGLAICEDLWKGEDAGFADRYLHDPDPVAELAAAGAQLILSPSGSPFVLGKGLKHRRLLAHHARTRKAWVAAVNQVGGNDDLVFDGHAAVFAADGALVAAAPGFREHLLVYDLESGPRGAVADPVLETPPEEQLFRALVLAVRDYVRKTGHSRVIIGLSGGIDSAVTAAIAAAALGPANVRGVALPGPYSSDHSREDAYELARRLGIECPTLPIEAPFQGFRAALDPTFRSLNLDTLGQSLPDLTEENLQSRIRGTTLMALSNRTGALVLTTGNKSELAVGYTTLYGDMNGGYAVLCDVSKMQVYALARWMNANPAAAGFSGPPIPDRSITKPPSAELRPNQTDQDSLPPYDVLDTILERAIERRESPSRIARETGIDAATVARVYRLLQVSEFKRQQLASGPKVTTVAFGTGRRYPIAQKWKPT